MKVSSKRIIFLISAKLTWRQGLDDFFLCYDYTVRNSSGEIVQFKWGDDGLDPATIEGSVEAVDFEKTWEHIANLQAAKVRV